MADLLSVGRAAFEGITRGYGRIGLSAGSRQLAEDFYNGGIQLFNQLYARTENQGINNQLKILALRAKNSSNLSEQITTVKKSNTTGTKVDTKA